MAKTPAQIAANSYVKTSITFGGKVCYDPRSLYEEGSRHGWSTNWFGKPSSYVCPLGKTPGYGWVLLPRKVLSELNFNQSQTLRFQFGDDAFSFPGLYIIQAKAIYFSPQTGGSATAHDDNLYLVEFTDCRRILAMSSVNTSYNCRVPAPTEAPTSVLTPGKCHTESLNNGSLHTWATLCSDLWMKLPSIAGSAPALPFQPVYPPEDFRFYGVSAWDALHVVLAKLNCTTKYNPTTQAFSFISLSNAQSDYAANISSLAVLKKADEARLVGNAATVPEKINVNFPRVDTHYGTEIETTFLGNWDQYPIYSITKNTNLSNAISGTSIVVWDDMNALQPYAGSSPINEAALQARASEVAARTAANISVSLTGKRSAYLGIHTSILPGSEVSYVKWCDDGYSGMYTEYGSEQAPLPPVTLAFAGLSDNHSGGGGSNSGEGTHTRVFTEPPIFPSRERLAPPDLSRKSHPIYPKINQLVNVVPTTVGMPDGTPIPRNGYGLWKGSVFRLNPDGNLTLRTAISSIQDCWIWVEDLTGGSLDASATLPAGERFLGRLNGSATAAGLTLPLYVVRRGGTPQVDGVPFVNEHFSTAPYGAMMQVLGTTQINNSFCLRVTRPLSAVTDFQDRSDVPRIFVVNKSGDVPYGEIGLASYGPAVEVLIGNWEVERHVFRQGDIWGPTDGVWWAHPSSFLGNCSIQGQVRSVVDGGGSGTGQDIAWGWLHPVVFLDGRINNSSSGVMTIPTYGEVQVEIQLGTYRVMAINRMTTLRVPANSIRNVFLYRHNSNQWWITAFQC